MSRFGTVIYIDKDPNDIYKGWGWIEVKIEDIKRLDIPTKYPDTYWEVCRSGKYDRRQFPGGGNLPSRGKAGTKKFQININGNLTGIRAQKTLTLKAICAWVKTWAPPNAKVITPEGKNIDLNSEKSSSQTYFVYFILNEDSNAIKIGLAKDVLRRLRSLQTSSPAHLRIIKTIQVAGREESQQLERFLHKEFRDLRIRGEWFKAESELIEYIIPIQNEVEQNKRYC